MPLELVVSLLVISVIAGLILIILWQRKQLSAQRGPTVEQTESVMPASQQIDTASNPLFATLSHELRTPLNGLLGISQMLNEEREDEDIQAIEGCARHMLAVLHTLVNLSKIQAEWEDLPEYREWVNVFELTEQLKKNLQFRAQLRGLDLEIEHQDKSLRIRGDWDHYRTILENALLGSIEGVNLSKVPTELQPMRLKWAAQGSDVLISITNPLEEFDPKAKQKINDAFRMTTGGSHARINMQYLYGAVATALLEKHNGVLLTSELDGGAVQTKLSFEAEQMQASESSNLPVGGLSLNTRAPSGKNSLKIPVQLSVLVAEDDPIARSLMESVLKHMGQDVTFALNGREVLEHISQSKFDVILMDIDMPLMDGVSAAIALRNGEAGELGSHIPIVAVTAFSTLSDQGKFKNAGMDYFLPKPVRLKHLRSVLVDVIRKEQHIADV